MPVHVLFLILLTLFIAEGRLPTIVEDRTDKSKDVFRVTPEPPTTSEDILVFNGFPLDNLQYIFDYKKADWVKRFSKESWITESTFKKATSVKNCKTLFKPGKVSFNQYTAHYESKTAKWYYSQERWTERDITPYVKELKNEENQFPLSYLRENCAPESYSGCWQVLEMKDVQFLIINSKNYQSLISSKCDFCVATECKITCPQGTFASRYASFDTESGLQNTKIECQPCPKGTWNTCLRASDCLWQVPEAGGFTVTVGNETANLRPAPVGTCFACEQARQWPQHYLNTPKAYTLPPNVKAWKCPGQDYAPVSCPSNQFTHSDDWSECICDGATYPDPTNSSSCIPCLAGHYCLKGKIYSCPDHYYQAETGQSACVQCASRPDLTGEYSLCENNKQLQMCDRKITGTQNRPLFDNCVECSKCKKLYSTIESGQLSCYRSYKAGAV